MPLLPPVIATLLADTKEYMAKMDEAEHKMGKFGAASDLAGGKVKNFANTASTAIIGLGGAMVAYGVDSALKFQKSLDALQNQAGFTAKQADEAGKSIMSLSNMTGISTENISSAYLQAAKAGLSLSRTQQLVNDAAKVSVITGGDVTSTTQTLVGIENLQIAKGMSVAQVSDLMVLANKRHLGSLDSLTSTLTGKVGGALAAAGVNLSEIAAISDVASAAGYGTAKSYAALATGLNKIESPTAKSAKAMGLLGINAQTLAADARHPGTGIVDVLAYLEQVSKKTGVSMNTLISGTFGPGSVGMVTDLANHIGTLTKNVKALGSASAGGLATAFGISKSQLDTQLEILKTQAENALTGIGLLLLPTVSDIAKFTENAVKYFRAHPLLGRIATDASIGLFATSLAYKVGTALSKLPGIGQLLNKLPGFTKLFGGQPTAAQAETQIGLLEQLVANTSIEDAELAAGKSASWITSVGSKALDAAGIAAIGYFGIKDVIGAWTGTHGGSTSGMLGGGGLLGAGANWVNAHTNGTPSGAPAGSGGYQYVPFLNSKGLESSKGVYILDNQISALNAWQYNHQNATPSQINAIVAQWANQDKQKNYTVKITVKA